MNPNETLPLQNVCLVDDDPAVIKSVGRLLTSDGFGVQTFSEPSNFLAYVAEHPVPLAILDVWMGEMSGLEVQARLRRVSPGTRVVMLTAKDDPSVRRMAMNAGASAFFIKGVESSEFLAGVKATADSLNRLVRHALANSLPPKPYG